NAVLLLFAGGLIAFIWFGPASTPPAKAPKLSQIDTHSVTRVRIERPGRPPIALRRSGVRWRMEAPFRRPADAIRVTALLGLASSRVHEAFRALGNDLAAFGLEPPVARVAFDDHEFLFGETETLNGWRYILYGPDVHLITDAYFHHILATPSAFVDPAPLADITGPISVAVDPSGRGMVASSAPSSMTQAADAARDLADAWIAAKASAVRNLDSTLDWREGVAVALKGTQSPIRFSVARNEREVMFARREWNLQYHFPRAKGLRMLGIRTAGDS
ncbi:MAG TPA: DUF4340 domain-containing protein, partial [Gammaproteobacteria bacterium]